MNRRTIMLIGMILLGFALGSSPQVALPQGSPLIGTWKLNLDKSKYSAERSATLNFTQDGQNIRLTAQGLDAQGNSVGPIVYMHIYDGQPHPTTGSSNIDASAYTWVDTNTYIIARYKVGKLVVVSTSVVSQDGKTITVTSTGIDANGRPTNTVDVYEKQ